jgi:hypothetical protein
VTWLASPGWWWWRLQILQWINSGRLTPTRRITALLGWWLPVVIMPLALLIAGAELSTAGLEFLLSLDVPLTLVISAVTALEALRIDARSTRDDWLWPRAFRPMQVRWLARLRWLLVARWPAGLTLAAALLSVGANAPSAQFSELLLMAMLGLAVGSCFAWTMQRQSASPAHRPVHPRRTRGMASLSWVAWHETRERFSLQRVTVLAIPALLAAPLGAMFSDAAKPLLIWLPLLFCVALCQSAMSTQITLQQWLQATGQNRLHLIWWIWRYLALGIFMIAGLGLWWRFT